MTVRPGPGPMATAHRVLIASALACAVLFSVSAVRSYLASGEGRAMVAAACGVVASVVIAAYFRSLRTLDAKLTPRNGGSR